VPLQKHRRAKHLGRVQPAAPLRRKTIVLIREYNESDLDALRRIHARQGFGYAFPDLADPLFVSKLIVEDDGGHPVMASLARLTCEMYLLVDRSDNANHPPTDLYDCAGKTDVEAGNRSGDTTRKRDADRERYAQLLALHRAGEQHLLACGLEDAHAWLPPRVARRFGRRLESLGWVRDAAWTPYCRRLKSSDS